MLSLKCPSEVAREPQAVMSPQQLRERGMAILGERADANAETLLRLAAAEGLDRRAAEGVIDQVRAAVSRWREFADQAEVPPLTTVETSRVLRHR
jgi:serine/threonine-protein kinase HipA